MVLLSQHRDSEYQPSSMYHSQHEPHGNDSWYTTNRAHIYLTQPSTNQAYLVWRAESSKISVVSTVLKQPDFILRSSCRSHHKWGGYNSGNKLELEPYSIMNSYVFLLVSLLLIHVCLLGVHR